MCSFRLHQQKQDKTADRSSVLEMEKRVRVRGGRTPSEGGGRLRIPSQGASLLSA